ncbi:hypothetical protein HNP46_000226 [Pseudomonas nitritireducens]|uniref:TrbC/VIRB2 family protein n=1 Tax=Pseudomonas nitroreducens TaxID=46680 RepID=A0A7W7KEK8_PSENT|nr:hypothetical protein [Pseudomonas nitritireducens]MBB4861415.1 hypothetical protein [Pseudomonas nitritireducens]
MLSKHKPLIGVGVTVALAMALFAVDANAANSFQSAATSWKSQINSILGLAKLIFGAAGVFMFAAGLFYIYRDQKEENRGHLKTGVMALLVGTGLMIIPWLIGLFTESVASGQGDDAASRVQGSNI